VTFEDTIVIAAPAGKVWDAILDVNVIAACMPGVEDVNQIDDKTFDGTILASVGPISGKFNFRATIVESNPPRDMKGTVVGTDSVTRSTIDAVMAMSLNPTTPLDTELAYKATVDIHGRLAILGEMVLRATGALMTEEFAKRLRAQLEA
jgi:uncharacterized protein